MENMNVTDLQHAGKLLAAMAVLRRNTFHCDVLLQAGSKASEAAGALTNEARGVWAHRSVLAAASPYFYKMFHSSFEECIMQVVVIKNVKLETLRALVENIYSPSALTVTVENAKALLAAATLLNVADVRDAACDLLTRSLTIDNVLGIYASAELHSCTTLIPAATQYIQQHFELVLQKDEFLTLTPQTLITLLKIDREAVTEERVFDAVLRWTQHHKQERRRYLGSLLRAVKLSLVPRQALVERVHTEPLISTEPRALFQVIAVLAPPPAALLIIGGGVQGSRSNSAWLYPLSGGRWQSIAALPEPRATAGAALFDGRVYVVGGRGVETSVRTVFIFDAATNSWSTGPPLTVARKWLGVATLDGRLYAVGGWNDDNAWMKWIIPNNTPYYSVEALDPREGLWRPVANMSTRRRGLGVATLGGKLYAVGGHDGNTALKSTERFDPAAGKWEAMEPMMEKRDAVRVGVINNTLYAVAGHNGSSVIQTVERYHVGSGWEAAPPLSKSRSGVAVTTHAGRLYAAGGYNNLSMFNPLSNYFNNLSMFNPVSSYFNNLSMFNPVTNQWSELPPLPMSCWATAAVVVNWTQSST